MKHNADKVGISIIGATLLGIALTGCNSQNTNPDGTTGVAPVTNTSPSSNSLGKGNTDDNMSGRGMNGNMRGIDGKMGDTMNGSGNSLGPGNEHRSLRWYSE